MKVPDLMGMQHSICHHYSSIGWIVKLTDVVPTDLEDLLTVEEYKSHLEDGSV